MLFSIDIVMIAYLQYLLTHKHAVPFGAIFSAYRVTDLSYLWSKELLGALTAPSFRGSMKAAFISVVIFSFLLAVAVGPSSAVAMQPRQANFTLPDYRIVLNTTSDALYPVQFDKAGPQLSPYIPTRNYLHYCAYPNLDSYVCLGRLLC